MASRQYWLSATWILAAATYGALPLSACGASQASPGGSFSEGAGGAADGSAGANSGAPYAGEATHAGAAATGDGDGAGGAATSPGGAGSGGEPGTELGGGTGDAGSGGDSTDAQNPAAFTGPDPFPCDSDGESVPPTFTTECDPASSWARAVRVKCDAAPGASLIGITPDELTIAWAEPERSLAHYYVADRGAPADDFGAKVLVSALNILCLSPDGLRLALLSEDRGRLLVLGRPDRSSEFGAESEGEFSELNADAEAQGFTFSSCAFAPDDRSLYYTAGAIDERYPLRVSTRTDTGPWPIGTAIETCEFEAHGGYGRYPSGVSADGKTLFFYDSWRGEARAAFRGDDTGAFTWFRDLGALFVPQANQACDRLYGSVADPAASIVSSERN